MFGPKCAVTIENALKRIDGIISARVNYATERAHVAFNPRRVTAAAMLETVQNEGFDAPCERVILQVNDLLYATRVQSVEHALYRFDGVIRVQIDFRMQRVVLDVLSACVNRHDYAHALVALGLTVTNQPSPHSARAFGVRAAIIELLALLGLFSAVAHVGRLDVSGLHAPLVVIAIAVFVTYGVGWPFYRVAYNACLYGQPDAGMAIALVASSLMFGGLPLALISSATQWTSLGFLLSTWLTAGWYLSRAADVWLLPRVNAVAIENVPAMPAQ